MSASEAERLRDIWGAVDSLIDHAPSLEDLREHRLHLLAERRWCETGRTIPAALSAEKSRAVALFLPVSGLLARIGAVWTGPMIILKGPELASRYPEGFRRTAGDIDLLVDDADAAHAALRAAGFVPTGDPRRSVDIHHLQPLVWPGLPVRIEVHHSVKWIEGLEPPSTAELFALAAPSRVDVDGFQTLTPAAHAVVVAIHAWSHGPLRSLRDLIDVAVLKAEADSVEIESLVAQWGVSGVWRTTDGVVEALFASGRRPLALRLWARHLESARSPTVAESSPGVVAQLVLGVARATRSPRCGSSARRRLAPGARGAMAHEVVTRTSGRAECGCSSILAPARARRDGTRDTSRALSRPRRAPACRRTGQWEPRQCVRKESR